MDLFASQLDGSMNVTNATGHVRRAKALGYNERDPEREKLRMLAKRIFDYTFAESKIEDRTDDFPKFDLEEVSMGRMLGRGGFGTVFEVHAFHCGGRLAGRNGLRKSFERLMSLRSDLAKKNVDTDNYDDYEVDQGEMESRLFIAQHCIRNGGDARYAIKVLSPSTLRNKDKCLQGIIDMAIETRMLTAIEHPNIVKMRAIAKQDPFKEGYFIVMDRLYDTLEERLFSWRLLKNQYRGLVGKICDRKGEKKQALLEERLEAAFDLSAALEYIHQHNILYRDLKPENIGFDIRGDIKIFDFGLCRELTDNLRNEDGTYNATEMTGSPRYMSPEVANGLPYNTSCDVYSFAILFWQILSLRTPYDTYTVKTLQEKVWNGKHKRPPLEGHSSWSQTCINLMQRGWDQDLHARQSMSMICKMLRNEVARLRGGDDTGLEHSKRRSTFVFHPRNKRSADKTRRPSGFSTGTNKVGEDETDGTGYDTRMAESV